MVAPAPAQKSQHKFQVVDVDTQKTAVYDKLRKEVIEKALLLAQTTRPSISNANKLQRFPLIVIEDHTEPVGLETLRGFFTRCQDRVRGIPQFDIICSVQLNHQEEVLEPFISHVPRVVVNYEQFVPYLLRPSVIKTINRAYLNTLQKILGNCLIIYPTTAAGGCTGIFDSFLSGDPVSEFIQSTTTTCSPLESYFQEDLITSTSLSLSLSPSSSQSACDDNNNQIMIKSEPIINSSLTPAELIISATMTEKSDEMRFSVKNVKAITKRFSSVLLNNKKSFRTCSICLDSFIKQLRDHPLAGGGSINTQSNNSCEHCQYVNLCRRCEQLISCNSSKEQCGWIELYGLITKVVSQAINDGIKILSDRI